MRQPILRRMAVLLLLGIAPYSPVAPRLAVSRGDAPKASSEKKIERLIEELGSDRFTVREAATRALIDWEDDPSALHKALKSPDTEVKRRVARILEARVSNRARRGLAKAQSLAKEGRVDEMVERLVFWSEWDQGKEGTKAVAELAARLIEWEHRRFGKTIFLSTNFPLPSFVKHSPKEPVTPKVFAEMWANSIHLRGREIVLNKREAETYNTAVIVASENVRAPFLGICGSVIVAAGNVQLGGIRNAVIICDGDLEVQHGLSNCLVIAHGKVLCHERAEVGGCTIFSSDLVVFSKQVTFGRSAILTEETPKVVKFFDVADVGFNVWQLYRDGKPRPDGNQIVDDQGHPALADGVWIKEIRKGTPFATRLRGGDVVTAINRTKTPSKETFRKVLRRKLAEGGPTITFTVRREKETLDVAVPIKD